MLRRGQKLKLAIYIAGQLNREVEATVGVVYSLTFEVVFPNSTGNVLVSERFYIDSFKHIKKFLATNHEYVLSKD